MNSSTSNAYSFFLRVAEEALLRAGGEIAPASAPINKFADEVFDAAIRGPRDPRATHVLLTGDKTRRGIDKILATLNAHYFSTADKTEFTYVAIALTIPGRAGFTPIGTAHPLQKAYDQTTAFLNQMKVGLRR